MNYLEHLLILFKEKEGEKAWTDFLNGHRTLKVDLKNIPVTSQSLRLHAKKRGLKFSVKHGGVVWKEKK